MRARPTDFPGSPGWRWRRAGHRPRRLIGASGYARQVVGTTIWPGMQSTIDDLTAATAAALGPAAFAAATADGARLRVPDALRYGLAVTADGADGAAADPFADWVSRLRPPSAEASLPGASSGES